MRKLLIPLLAIFILFISFSSCESNGACGACTDDLRQVSVTIIDQGQNPVALDNFQVINRENNQNITLELSDEEFQDAQQNGRYPLANDLSIATLEILQIQFRGFQGGTQIITENYTIASDCCSKISSVEGNQEITID
jgi:hypothetical protein